MPIVVRNKTSSLTYLLDTRPFNWHSYFPKFQNLVMKYKFPGSLQSDFSDIKSYIRPNEEISKESLLEKCAGKIDRDLLLNLKELDFALIGKDENGELYIKGA